MSTITIPSAVTLLVAAQAAFLTVDHPSVVIPTRDGVYALLDDTARTVGVPWFAQIAAANALDTAVITRGRLDAATFDAAISALVARRLDLDAWLADQHGWTTGAKSDRLSTA